jgi:hypothetical protein
VAQVADPAAGRFTRAPGAVGLLRPARCHNRIAPLAAPAAAVVVAVRCRTCRPGPAGPRGPRRARPVPGRPGGAGAGRGRRRRRRGPGAARWPNTSPASGPVAHTSPLVAAPTPRPAASSWSPGVRVSGICGGRCRSGRIVTTPQRDSPTVLEVLAFRLKQRLVFGRMGGDQAANRGPPCLAGAPLPAGIEFRQPGALAALAAQVDRACAPARRDPDAGGDRPAWTRVAGSPCSSWRAARGSGRSPRPA